MAAPLALFVIIIAVWEICVSAFHISRTILPRPEVIVRQFVQNFARDIWPQMQFSLWVILTGYVVSVVIGILIAAVCSQFKLVTQSVSPLIILFLVTPMNTLVPIFMLWMGFNPMERILIVILQTTPIIALNTISGFSKVENSKIELMRSMGATRVQTFCKLIFPNALPQVFTGLKLGCIFSIIAAMGADLEIGKSGLGYRISEYSSLTMTEMAYGTIILVALMGNIMFEIVAKVERKLIVWLK